MNTIVCQRSTADWHRRWRQLATEFILSRRPESPTAAVIKACAAVERADTDPFPRDDRGALLEALVERPDIQRDIFWFDVQEARWNRRGESITGWWELGFYSARLWHLNALDIEWLLERIGSGTVLQDRRIALSALISRLGTQEIHTHAHAVFPLINGIPELEGDFRSALSPPPEEPHYGRRSDLQQIAASNREEQQAGLSQNWLNFANRVRADSSHLRDRAKLAHWAHACDLLILTEWLIHRTGKSGADAVLKWPLLSEAFGDDVAHSYSTGMKILWRLTIPRIADRGSFDRREQLSFYGVCLEAEEGPNWAEHITGDEAELAVRHALYGAERAMKWIEDIALIHFERVRPLIAQEVAIEWTSTSPHSKDVVSSIGNGGDEYFRLMADLVIGRLHEPPSRFQAFDAALRVLTRYPSSPLQRAELIAHAKHGLARKGKKNEEWAVRQLALMFACDFVEATNALRRWLSGVRSDEKRNARGLRAFALLFSRHHPLVADQLFTQSAGVLSRLLQIAYRTVRIEEDVRHEGIYSPGLRDEAEAARARILDALLATPGRGTFHALCRLADDSSIGSRKRFRELAQRRAEEDSELPVWSPADVVAFERQHAAPAKTGADLLRITASILDDIQTDFHRADASSRYVLEAATDEKAVQHWLAEQFTLRSRGRFTVYREVEAADGKEPDIVLASSSAPIQVAIEVKHGGKRWTVRDFEVALREQLMRDYLRPASRRHGVLVITRHTNRQWKDPATHSDIDFEQLLVRLRRFATAILNDETGEAVEALVIGLDATSQEQKTPGLSSKRRPKSRRRT